MQIMNNHIFMLCEMHIRKLTKSREINYSIPIAGTYLLRKCLIGALKYHYN